MSVLFRVPRAATHKGFALIGVISTALLVGASAVPTGAQSTVGPTTTSVAELEPVDGRSSTAGSGSAAQFRLKGEHDRLVLRLSDQLVYLGSVSAHATPGSPAQFRAHEEAESLREQLRSMGRG